MGFFKGCFFSRGMLFAAVLITCAGYFSCFSRKSNEELNGSKPVGVLPTFGSDAGADIEGEAFGPSMRFVGKYPVTVSPSHPDFYFGNYCKAPPPILPSNGEPNDYLIGGYIKWGQLFDMNALADKYRLIFENSPTPPPDPYEAARQAIMAVGNPNVFGRESGSSTENFHYCYYEYVGPGSLYNASLFKESIPSDVEPDYPSVAVQQSPPSCTGLTEESIWNETGRFLMERALEQVGALVPTWNYDHGSGAEVHVALLDTMPYWSTGETVPMNPKSWHGHGVASWIDSMACPDQSLPCPVTIDSYPALNLNSDSVSGTVFENDLEGGWFGYNSELAVKLVEAIYDWRVLRPQTKQVVNISAGSEGNIAFVDYQNSPVYESLRSALKFGTCLGAFFSVAAGNQPGGTAHHNLEGALIPGSYHVLSAPDPSENYDAITCVSTDGEPLVATTVFGLDQDGDPLGNTRPMARTVNAAYGDDIPTNLAALKPVYQEDMFINRLTGTSMAAGVASALASVLWAKDASLSVESIRNIMRDSGDDIGLTPDFWFDNGGGTGTPKVHALNLCSAVETVDPSFDCLSATLHRTISDAEIANAVSCYPQVAESEIEEIEVGHPSCPWTTLDVSLHCGTGETYNTNELYSSSPFVCVNSVDQMSNLYPDWDPCPDKWNFNYQIGSGQTPQPLIHDDGGELIFNRDNGILTLITTSVWFLFIPASNLVYANLELILEYDGVSDVYGFTDQFISGQGTVVQGFPYGIPYTKGRLIGELYDQNLNKTWYIDDTVLVVGQ